jgi:cell wall-associated NlpC family hydrolase
VKLSQVGAADGTWLVETIRRTTYSKQVTVDLVKPVPTLPEPKGQRQRAGTSGSRCSWRHTWATRRRGSRARRVPRSSSGSGRDEGVSSKTDLFVRTALAQQGKPYVYGASGPNSWDCSGFVQWLAGQVGISFSKPVSSAGGDLPQPGHDVDGGAGEAH